MYAVREPRSVWRPTTFSSQMEVIEDPHSAPIHVVSPLARSYFLLANCVQSLDIILVVQPGTSS